MDHSYFLFPVPEFVDPVFAKTSPKRAFSIVYAKISPKGPFSMIENERFGLVFAKTGSCHKILKLDLPKSPQIEDIDKSLHLTDYLLFHLNKRNKQSCKSLSFSRPCFIFFTTWMDEVS